MRRPLFLCWCASTLLIGSCLAQETLPPAPQPQEQTTQSNPLEKDAQKVEHALVQLRNLPAERLIGPYIPSSGPLIPLTGQQRLDVYLRQNFFSVGPYALHIFTAGIDQARDYPSQWGGGMAAYGDRFGNRFGRSAIADSFAAVGNAALGYEPRYDFCRCRGFWPRTRHAVRRNFFAYNHTESELRFAAPLYVASFGSGMLSSVWLPGNQNLWRDGAYAALSQAGWGSAYNWVSEFSLDILRKITKKKYPRNEPGGLP